MDIALLVLRVVVGAFFVGHGAQKLFGRFGGHGLEGTAGFFETLGMRPGRRHAAAAGAAELAGGALLVLGLLTPLAAALIIAVMVVAIATVHANKGPWVTDGGWEYNAVLIAAAFAIAGAGPGEVSLDDALGWMPDITGTAWAFIALAAGALGALGALLTARTAAAPQPEPAPAADRTGRFARDTEPAQPAAADAAQRERPGMPADPR
ncbi:MAG TPA: DoxX family protein [Solirubrobacteraceae bacterium]|jgi:putative oxidoreductase